LEIAKKARWRQRKMRVFRETGLLDWVRVKGLDPLTRIGRFHQKKGTTGGKVLKPRWNAIKNGKKGPKRYKAIDRASAI